MPPDPPISFCTLRGSSYKRSVPMLCPSNGDGLATPLDKPSLETFFRMHQGTDYIKTAGQDFPLGSISGTDYIKTNKQTDYLNINKSSPGTLFRLQVHQETDHIKTKTNKSSPGTLFRVHQEINYMKTAGQAFPWDPFQDAPGDRLCPLKRLHWDGAYIRKYAVYQFICIHLCSSEQGNCKYIDISL